MKMDPDKATRAELQMSLKPSATAMRTPLEKALNHPAGNVPHSTPDVVAFVGYLIAHDSHRRGPIAMPARQVGHPVPTQMAFGVLGRGTLWRERGSGK